MKKILFILLLALLIVLAMAKMAGAEKEIDVCTGLETVGHCANKPDQVIPQEETTVVPTPTVDVPIPQTSWGK